MDIPLLDTSLLVLDRIGLALLLATCISSLWLNPRISHVPISKTPIYFIDVSLILLIITTCCVLLLRTAALADVPITETYPYLYKVVTTSHFGTTWLGRSSALLFMVILWFCIIRQRPITPFYKLLTISTICIAFFISGASHAGEQGLWTLENITNTLHILAGCLWGGSVIFYAFIFKQYSTHQMEYSETAHRLTAVATIALILVLLTAGLNAFYRLNSLNDLWNSDYGITLLLKAVFVGLMMTIGALNRFVFIPKVDQYELHDDNQAKHSQKTFRYALYFDSVVFLIIMLIATTLATMSPGH